MIGFFIYAAIGSAHAEPQSIETNQRLGLGVTLYGAGVTLINDQRKMKLITENNKLLFSGVSPLMISDSAQLESTGVMWVDQQELLPANMNRRELLKMHLVKTIKVVKTNLKTGEKLAVDAEILSTKLFLILRIGGPVVTDVSDPLFYLI